MMRARHGEPVTMQLLGKMLGDPNKKEIKAMQPVIDKINALEANMQKLSDEQLAAKTAEFRAQLALYLKGGLVLEDQLLKIFRDVLEVVEHDPPAPGAPPCAPAPPPAAVAPPPPGLPLAVPLTPAPP